MVNCLQGPCGSCGRLGGTYLHIQRVSNCSSQVCRGTSSLEADKQELWVFTDGVIPNRYEVQAPGAQCLQHSLQLVGSSDDFSLNHRILIRA